MNLESSADNSMPGHVSVAAAVSAQTMTSSGFFVITNFGALSKPIQSNRRVIIHQNISR